MLHSIVFVTEADLKLVTTIGDIINMKIAFLICSVTSAAFRVVHREQADSGAIYTVSLTAADSPGDTTLRGFEGDIEKR